MTRSTTFDEPDNSLERRASAGSLSIDVSEDNLLRGYPIIFNKLSQDLGGFRERILPSAVDRSLTADIRALVDHETGKVLGRTRAGTLSLKKDATGLRMKLEPDMEISYARDIVRAVARGDVSGMSFGFRVIEDEWMEEGKTPIRDVLDMQISEVSVVTFPAYLDTNVEYARRSLQAFEQTKRAYNWRQKWHEIKTA